MPKTIRTWLVGFVFKDIDKLEGKAENAGNAGLNLKAFADDKINVTEKFKFVLGWVENMVRKEENNGYQHFLLFPQCFQKASFSESLKVVIVW